MELNALYHHGILGMHWGIRRFQNKDGSLTNVGKKRYSDNDSSSKEKTNPYVDKNGGLTEAGYKSLEDGVLRKGMAAYRIANSDEAIDSKRKYVSITDEDTANYGEMFDALGADLSKPISQYTYGLKNDVKLAKGEDAVKRVLEMYGDEKIKKITENHQKLMKEDEDYRDGTYGSETRREVNNFFNKAMKEHGDDIITSFKKQGYGGMMDPEDYVTGFAKYPVVLFDPSNTLELRNERRFG